MDIESNWQWLGWSAWILVPLWAMLAYGFWRLKKREWPALLRWSSALAWFLRVSCVAILFFMLAEPIISQQQKIIVKPSLTIVIDQSASMQLPDLSLHPTYLFDELQALGSLTAEQRPRIAKECQALLNHIRQFILEISKRPLKPQDSKDILALSKKLQPMLNSFIGNPAVGDQIHDICNLIALTASNIESNTPIHLQLIVDKINPSLLQALQGLQQHADSALAAGANGSEQLQQAIQGWNSLSRFQRASNYIQQAMLPMFAAQLDMHIVPLHAPQDSGSPIKDISLSQQMRSDFSQCFDTLNRQLGGDQQQHILLLSDGIHNGDKDPLPVARALGARGIPIDTLLVGDLDQPRDAVVLDIIGPSEMYRADDIPITVRYRISGFPGLSWNLTLTINGTEYDRRTVVGNDNVQEQYFTVSKLPATRLIIEASLQARVDIDSLLRDQQSWLEEIWTSVPETTLLDFFSADLIPPAESVKTILTKDIQHNRIDTFIRRLSSYIIPPADGWYQFYVSGDDQGMLWLSTDHRLEHRSLLAYFEQPCKESQWDQFASQQSQKVYLRKDQPYYLEITHQDFSHFDQIQVAWSTPINQQITEIGDEFLIPFGDNAIAKHLSNRIEHNVNNNSREHIIITHSDPLRILLIDQYPRWETRLISSLLNSDEGIQIDKHFVGLQQQSKSDTLFSNLEQYDALVLGDISVGVLNNEIQDRLAHAVREHGLLLIVIAGRQSMPHGFALGPLANILPIRVNAAQSEQAHAWHLSVLSDDSLTNLDTLQWEWESLPEFSWINGHVTAKPEAKVHLTASSKDGTQIPYCCSQHIGAGRVVYFGSDESWRWREKIGKTEHRKWWRHVLQWGLQSRLHGSDPRLRVAISQRQADHAKQILVHARCAENGNNLNDGLSLTIQQLDGKQQQWLMQMHSSTQSQTSLCIGDHLDLSSGQYRATVHSQQLPHLLEEREFWIRPPHQTELNYLGTDAPLLKRISQTSQGDYFTFDTTPALIAKLQKQLKSRVVVESHIIHLWRTWYLFILVVCLLVSEWWLRKRCGLP